MRRNYQIHLSNISSALFTARPSVLSVSYNKLYSTDTRNEKHAQRSFFFDMDGTLCDSESINSYAHLITLRKIKDKYNLKFTLPNRNLIKNCTTGITTLGAMEKIFQFYPEISRFKIEYSQMCAQYFFEEKSKMRGNYLIKSSVELLSFIVENDYRVCIVSGSPCSEIVENIKLMSIPKSIPYVGLENYSQGKPAPDPYLRAAELLGISPNRACIAFEDSTAGVKSAKSAGMFVVGFARERNFRKILIQSGADYVVDNLNEIRDKFNKNDYFFPENNKSYLKIK